MAARVTVFIDWQNVYGSARRTFHRPHDPYVDGQVDPVRLATWLTHRNADQELHQVRVYRELPDSTRQPASYGANERQAAAWSASGVTVVRRPLMYPRGWPDMSLPGDRPREKGIDVALAIDFVRLAIEDSYDVGILISGDTDLNRRSKPCGTTAAQPGRVPRQRPGPAPTRTAPGWPWWAGASGVTGWITVSTRPCRTGSTTAEDIKIPASSRRSEDDGEE